MSQATDPTPTSGQRAPTASRRLLAPLRRHLPVPLKRLALFVLRLGPLRGPRLLARLRHASEPHLRVVPPGHDHPLTLRTGSSDVGAFLEVFIDRDHELPVALAPRLILDIGANVGCSAVDLAHRYPEARVVAVEPEPSNLQLLRTNTAPYPNIEVVEGAVWPSAMPLVVDNPDADRWSYRMRPARTGEPGTVRGLTVEELAPAEVAPTIDILKLDIEGAEGELFAHPCPWLERVRVLVIELHERYHPGCTAAFRRAIDGHGFRETVRGVNHILVRRAPSPAAPRGAGR